MSLLRPVPLQGSESDSQVLTHGSLKRTGAPHGDQPPWALTLLKHLCGRLRPSLVGEFPWNEPQNSKHFKGEKPYVFKSVADREKEREEEKPGSSTWQYLRPGELQSLLSAVLPHSLAVPSSGMRPRTGGSSAEGEGARGDVRGRACVPSGQGHARVQPGPCLAVSETGKQGRRSRHLRLSSVD